MGLYIDDMEQYKDYIVLITNAKAGIRLQGLLNDEELSISSGASWGSSVVAGAAEGVGRGVATKIATKFAGEMVGNTVRNELKTVLSTFKGYEGDNGVTFPSITMNLFANRFGNGSYHDIELMLAKLTQPDTSKFTDRLKSYLYDSKDTLKIAGGVDPFKNQLVHISVGDWLLGTGLVCDNVSRNYSKYVDDTGKPIYLQVTFNFSPYKSLNAEELASWITK